MTSLDGAVLGSGEDKRKLGMEAGGRDVVGVGLQGLDAGLGLVVPNLDQTVVGTGDQVGPARDNQWAEETSLDKQGTWGSGPASCTCLSPPMK